MVKTLHKGIKQTFSSQKGNKHSEKSQKEQSGPKADNRWTIHFFTRVLFSYTKPTLNQKYWSYRNQGTTVY